VLAVQALANLLTVPYWPMWVGCAFLFFVALLYQLIDRVPNVLTFSAIVAAWVVGLLLAVPGLLPPAGGGIASSLVCTVACPMMLLKAYKIGLGAGCLKAQMALGAWIGCALPLESALIVSVFATLIGGSTMAILWIIEGRLRGKRLSEISLGDNQSADSRPFPAQIPLSLGSIGGVLLAFVLSDPGPRPLALPPPPQAAAGPAQAGGIN
jgi:hypothetical protein